MGNSHNTALTSSTKPALSYFDYALTDDSEEYIAIMPPAEAPITLAGVALLPLPPEAEPVLSVLDAPAGVIAEPQVPAELLHTTATHMNWVRLAGFTLPTIGLIAALGGMLALTLGGGCTETKLPTEATARDTRTPSPTALDVTPPPAPIAPAVASATPVPTPQTDGGIVTEPLGTQTPTLAGGTDSAVPVRYTVQKGDSLFRIAHEHYGDGKQWKRIVAANPGVTPKTLKVGQQLVIP